MPTQHAARQVHAVNDRLGQNNPVRRLRRGVLGSTKATVDDAMRYSMAPQPADSLAFALQPVKSINASRNPIARSCSLERLKYEFELVARFRRKHR